MIEKIYKSKPVPKNATFYKMPVTGENLRFNSSVLEEHYSLTTKKRDSTKGRFARFVSFKNDITEVVLINRKTQEVVYFYFRVSPEAVEVYCECGMPGGLLCKHLYQGFSHILIGTKGVELKKYYWPGYSSTDKGGIFYLDITPEPFFYSLKIRAKAEFGNLYLPNLGFKDLDSTILTPVESVKVRIPTASQFNPAIVGYCLAHNSRRRSWSHPSFLLPYFGIMDVKGIEIKKFNPILPDTDINDINFTENQQRLNAISSCMFDIVSFDYWSIKSSEGRELRMAKDDETVFEFWSEAISLLSTERFTHKLYSGNMNVFFSKNWLPSADYYPEIRFDSNCPVLSFLLSDMGPHYSLELIIKVHQKKIDFIQTKIPYFVTDFDERVYYLLSSMQDERLVNWICDNGNRLTILKPYFHDFYERFLKVLLQSYAVNYHSKKTKKPVPFDWSLIETL